MALFSDLFGGAQQGQGGGDNGMAGNYAAPLQLFGAGGGGRFDALGNRQNAAPFAQPQPQGAAQIQQLLSNPNMPQQAQQGLQNALGRMQGGAAPGQAPMQGAALGSNLLSYAGGAPANPAIGSPRG